MAITATYVSATSFTVAEDRRLWFVPGRAVRCDCGVNGVKFGYVDYSSYSSVTTVNLLSSESEALTNNLASVELSIFRPDSVNTGSAPLEDILMLRGFKTGMTLEYKDADEFYVNVGSIHIDDGTYDRIYQVTIKLTKSVTGLSNSTWYHVYAAPPANGLTLTATEITYSTTAPSVDDTKGGKLYHPTDGTKRCIGWVYSNGSSNISSFIVSSGIYQLAGTEFLDINASAPSTTWTTYTVSSAPVGNLTLYSVLQAGYSNNWGWIYYRKDSSSGGGVSLCYADSTTTMRIMRVAIFVNSSKQFDLKYQNATTNTIYLYTSGFYMPEFL